MKSQVAAIGSLFGQMLPQSSQRKLGVGPVEGIMNALLEIRVGPVLKVSATFEGPSCAVVMVGLSGNKDADYLEL
jgi:hypothetical protein